MSTVSNPIASRGAGIQQVRVAETVAAELRRRILRGDFPDGALPKQDQLREEYGISHPSLREALRILETEGLVVVRRGNVGGAIVQQPGEARFGYTLGLALQSSGVHLHELATAVATLEPVCARLCAENPKRGKQVVPRLRAILDTARGEEGSAEGVPFTRAARSFHGAVVDLCGNEPTKMIVGGLVALWDAQEEAWAQDLTAQGAYPDHDRRVATLNAHNKLLDLIEAGDGLGAEDFSRRHIRSTQKVILSRIEDRVIQASSVRSSILAQQNGR
ncbi:FadR/GntR family transcriptional regulator [Agromyces aerolatus]|uniref:FadR/GntR family transcriptional regulator n=1 Tax=Agromyces sp. LY-1074 TaxID=3074080 RepID=UPI00285C53AE|nr:MULTISPECIES: FCD domain-containing protein [unclassified Agromyces]MDR5699097.1 FCD domain-containing protein [Agromyces sp. LY-1074]MDR5705124.1 FCD domain-containing protein [Agromyces sp. LY-1358]